MKRKRIYVSPLLLLIGCLALLTLTVVSFNAIPAFDNAVVQAIYDARSTAGLAFFALVTRLADTWAIVLVLSLACLLLLLSKQSKAWVVGLLVAVLGAKVSEVCMKILIGRERPLEFALLELDTFSFPSGHAAVAMALYGFLTYLLFVQYPKYRAYTLVLGGLLVILVGASRVYIGVHYPSDVLGGYVLGAIWLLVGVYAVRYWRS